jgi:hypothetical protein
MHRILAVISLVAFTITLTAQGPGVAAGRGKPAAPAAATGTGTAVIKDLPVRKVVLYKNGVGYFEHAGTVVGNQKVAIDFTSPQLNDVLQSLTVLDEGGGRVAGVNYNSTTPLAEQLKSLSLGMTDDPTSTELFQALRGQRVEVTGGPGGILTGRLMSIESRTEKVGAGDNDATSNAATIDKFYLTLVASSGAVRVIELTPALSVRPLDASFQGQLDRYLELLSTTHSTGLRHLTLDSLGAGQRELRVSYISEVPVWKSTYRMVFPRTANGSAIVQGWAVVDNTVGADWDNVQLSLVAGAPQSFIQPLSQPIYTRRPEIPIATEEQLTPQTHEAAETVGSGTISGTVTDVTGAVVPGATVTATAQGSNTTSTQNTSGDGTYTIGSLASGRYTLRVTARGFQSYVQQGIAIGGQQTENVDVRLNVGAATETVTVEADARESSRQPLRFATKSRNFAALGALGMGVSALSPGVYRASDAVSEGDVSTNAFDDFFEYSLAQPVTIHKNESAMVPILQQELPAEHVTLWSEREKTPLRAVWLENKSKLTLDSGSFSIFESGEFAGEGLLDPIHPGEKRLLSYAADQAVKVHRGGYADTRTLHHIAMHEGIVVESTTEVTENNYTVSNAADEARMVIVEHPRRANAELDSEPKPAETTPTAYRFRVAVQPHESVELHVGEKANLSEKVRIDPNGNWTEYLINVSKFTPALEEKLRPLIDAETALSDLNVKIQEVEQKKTALAADEARDRDNLTALKGNDAAKRFVEELNRAEDDIQAARKDQAELEKQRDAARTHLELLIAALSFDTDLSVVTQSTQYGDRPPQR